MRWLVLGAVVSEATEQLAPRGFVATGKGHQLVVVFFERCM